MITLPAVADTGQERLEDRTFVADYDQTEQKYVVLPPVDFDPDGPVDLLIALHGHGSDRWQSVRNPRGECRAMRDVAAKYGLLMISPDYRAKTSWMGPAAEADVKQILSVYRQQYSVRHVILCGGSMGGTSALIFAVRNPELVDGVVSLNGTANLVEYDRFSEAIAESYGGTRQEIPHAYHNRSAEFFADRLTMPIAVTTGGKDTIVPPDSVLRLLPEIRRHNSRVLGIHRPGGGHSSTYEDSHAVIEYVVRQVTRTSER